MPKWRVLLGGLLKLCVALACLVGAIAACRQIIGPLIDAAFGLGPRGSSIVRRISIFASAVLAYWAFTHYYEKRKAPELSLRVLWISLGAAAGALSIGATILILYASGTYQLVSYLGFGGFGDVFSQLWIAAVLEEIAFRGILFRILEERIGVRAALLGSAVIFSASHVTNNGARWITVLSVMLAGLMWALIFSVWRNVWAVAAHHCCWNTAIFATGLPLSGEDWRSLAPLKTITHGSILLTGGPFGPEDSLVNIAISTAICVALWRIATQRAKLAATAVKAGA